MATSLSYQGHACIALGPTAGITIQDGPSHQTFAFRILPLHSPLDSLLMDTKIEQLHLYDLGWTSSTFHQTVKYD
jgi:hypothetical protein